ncbi:MAG: methyltransferase domain-containing protein [Candidatus Brocadiaceae bacterium]|nr:methyltransferase domain-containing protein [Candidatus Brocadiaceae bacterium]
MPKVYLKQLETLWFQVTGTHCNLQCTHCFISCGPKSNDLDVLDLEVVRRYLNEALTLGVKEFYFTGGEPFLHPEIAGILQEALKHGQTTVLSNGTLITKGLSQTLAKVSCISKHKLEFRVSLESFIEEENDQIRGMGSFKSAIRGIQFLVHAGFNPIITVADWSKYGKFTKEMAEGSLSLERSLNIPQLRLKKLPLVLLGRCAEFVRPYDGGEWITEKCFDNYQMDNLQCTTSRIVTSKGVFVCPILIADPKAWMGWTLQESLKPYTMGSPACYTCRTTGLTCKNDDPLSCKTNIFQGDKMSKVIVKDTVRESVNEFYATAAIQPQKELCCPTNYNPADLSHIPPEVLKISYGCGSPVTQANIEPGESMLDLGSGGGIDCFIAAKMAGEQGQVIGIDMTDEMLRNANATREIVARNLGYNNVRFMKGFLEEIPVTDECVDLVTSNCVINLSAQKEKVFQEIFRVLKTGGRFVISDIVSDREVPVSMKQDKKLWGECISGAITEAEFFNITRKIGFYGLEIVNRYLYKEVDGFTFYSITARGHKFKKSKECVYTGQYAIYKGPCSNVSDDDGHTYPVGTPIEICTDTAWKLSNPPYEGMFILSGSMQSKDVKTACGPKCC